MDDAARFEAELRILRLMLSRAVAETQLNARSGELTAVDQLSDYGWADHEHRVVYECLRAARRTRVAPIRSEMASIATRLGHPDLDWDSYFGQPTEDLEVVGLIDRLKRNSL